MSAGGISDDTPSLNLLAEDAKGKRLPAPNQRARVIIYNREGTTVSSTAILVSTGALGAELLVEGELAKNIVPPNHIELTLPRPHPEGAVSCVVVCITPTPAGDALLSCRIVESVRSEVRASEQRRAARWRCLDDFQPTGVAVNPFTSNDFVYFRVKDISPNGFGVVTSVRNKFLTKGCRLESVISFPIAGRVSIALIVKNLRIASDIEKDYLHLGVEFASVTPAQRQVIGQYVLQFGDAETTSQLQRHGFFPTEARREPRWTFVNNEESYREALNLRLAAYSKDHKLPKDSSVAEVSDAYDSRSKIILGRVKGRAVATARLYFPEHNDRLEHEEFMVWPPGFPRREEIVEVTRTCTHPDFRRGNVFFSLLRYIVVTSVQSQRKWVMTSATSDLVPFYDWVGLKPTDVVFNHSSLNSLPHRLLLGSIPDALSGKTVGATAWYLIWRDAISMLDSQTLNGLTFGTVRSLVYRTVGAIGSLTANMRLRR
jgi:hypothetical protein